MSLSSTYLDAFKEIARTGGFTQAAKVLNISQSALSQRVKNLEEDMGLTLFIRTPTGAKLTEQGERLLRYCQTRDSLEEELVQELNASHFFELAGTIRIGCYSSVLRSVVIPSLTELLQEHPHILCEFTCAKMHELPEMLQRAEVDFIIMDYAHDRDNLQKDILGKERLVPIESRKASKRNDVYLDNDHADLATKSYFKLQKGKMPKYRRAYFDDCYGIIDGVEAGLGKAVMSEHLVKGNKSIKITKGKSLDLDVVLHYYKQPFYSKLHQAVIESLVKNSGNFLK